MPETIEYGGGCKELGRDANLPPLWCCGLCHDDVDDGHSDPSERLYMGKQYGVCCRVATAFDVAHPRVTVEESGRQAGKTDLLARLAPSGPQRTPP